MPPKPGQQIFDSSAAGFILPTGQLVSVTLRDGQRDCPANMSPVFAHFATVAAVAELIQSQVAQLLGACAARFSRSVVLPGAVGLLIGIAPGLAMSLLRPKVAGAVGCCTAGQAARLCLLQQRCCALASIDQCELSESTHFS
jgi:hypothetical protein